MKIKILFVSFILLVASCSILNERSASVISDWFTFYSEGTVLTYEVTDSLIVEFVNDSMSADNYYRYQYQARDSVLSVTNEDQSTIIEMQYYDDNDSTYSYFLICDRNMNRIFISENETFEPLSDIVILYVPVRATTQWVSMGYFDYNTYEIMSLAAEAEGADKSYYGTIYIEGEGEKAGNIEKIWYLPDMGIIRKTIKHETVSINDSLHSRTIRKYSQDYKLLSIKE